MENQNESPLDEGKTTENHPLSEEGENKIILDILSRRGEKYTNTYMNGTCTLVRYSEDSVIIAMEEYATSKSNEYNLFLMEEIEKLKGEVGNLRVRNANIIGKSTWDDIQLNELKEKVNSYEFVNSNLRGLFENEIKLREESESQLAEAKKEIESLKAQLDIETSISIDLQSQLQESEERNKQLVEALEKIKNYEINHGLSYPNIISKIKQIAVWALSFKDNNKQK